MYVVHPQCRGYVHRTVFYIQQFTITTVLICARSCRSFQPSKIAHLSAKPSQKPSTHSAAEVVHALSWDLTLNPKIDLISFASHHHNIFYYLIILHKCLFIKVHYYNTMGTHNQGNFTKRGASTQPRSP